MEGAHPVVLLDSEGDHRAARTMQNAPVASNHALRFSRRARRVENAGGCACFRHRARELRVFPRVEAINVELRYAEIRATKRRTAFAIGDDKTRYGIAQDSLESCLRQVHIQRNADTACLPRRE